MILSAMTPSVNVLSSWLRELAWKGVKFWVRRSFPSVEHISTAALQQQLTDRAQFLLVDTRKPAEYAVSHLPGAVRAESVEAIQQLCPDPKDGNIIAYCSIGYRSARLAQQLAAAGYRAVNLEGSLFQWANENRPLVRNHRQTTQVHPYSSTWALLLKTTISKTTISKTTISKLENSKLENSKTTNSKTTNSKTP